MEILCWTSSIARCPRQEQTNKKKSHFIPVVICKLLNVACILAQWHEAALLCKGKPKSSWNCSLRWCCFAKRLSLVLSPSLLEVRPFLVSCREFGVCADFGDVPKTLLTKLGKEERFSPGFSWNSPQIRGIFQHYNDLS